MEKTMKQSEASSLNRKTLNTKIHRQSLCLSRNRLTIFVVLSTVLFLSPLAAENLHNQPDTTKVAAAKDHTADWGYLGVEGPSHWGMISKEYMACETGNRQSPINISTSHHNDHQLEQNELDELDFHYNTSQLHQVNNGHTIQISHVTGCHVNLNKRVYKLRQFHFHSPSEHHIEGKSFPMEMHLVHQDEADRVLVISVLMKTGATQSVLGKFWEWLPNQIGQEVSIPLELDLTEILPASSGHYTYTGSLTTPPCTEGIQWIVLKEPMQVSQEDVDQFVQIIGPNARPIQPLGERHIEDD